MTAKDLSSEFASFAANCRFEDLPADAIESAKKSVLDLLGVSLAATGTAPAIRSVVEMAVEDRGNADCSIIGFSQKTSALMAAFANGAMAHALDFDDQGADGHHPSSSIVPAVFAAAERVGQVSGRDLITAVAVGQDLFLRMRRNIEQRQDWHMTTVLGVFSATASVSCILGLNERQISNALGIASLGSCGTLEMRYGTESELGQLYAGFVAKNALLAAMLAEKEITGTQSLFEGKAGILNVYFGGKYDRASMISGLGRKFAGGTLQYKPWPTCGLSHSYIHATLKILREHALQANDIREIRPFVGDFQQQMCYPIDVRRSPSTSMDARFSLPFSLATAVVYGEVGVLNFTSEGLTDQAVLAAAKKVVPVNDSSLDWSGNMPNAKVEILTNGGDLFSSTGEGTPGGADNPMGWPEILKKFATCAALALNPPSSEIIGKVQGLVTSLQAVEDVRPIMQSVSCQSLND